MRFEAVRAIYEAGVEKKNLWFITGDLGHMKTEEFRRDFGERYINGGMSEQNIIGTAAGLALSGQQVVAYSIVPFITLRCYEQIKLDVCEQNVNVIVLGVGGGFAYGAAGATHYSIEELGAFRMMPHMKVVCPSDPAEAYALMKQLLEIGGPAYMRIGRGKEAALAVQVPPVLGKASVLKDGKTISIISQGTIVSEALRAAEMLEAQGISTEVINMHTLKPLDKDIIVSRAGERKGIFVLEEHNIYGGLGSAVAEVIAQNKTHPEVFQIFGISDEWPKLVGNQAYLREQAGISAEHVTKAIITALDK